MTSDTPAAYPRPLPWLKRVYLALALAARLADETTARAIQLGIEYDPRPPFDSGSAAKASPEILGRVAALMRQRDEADGG